VEILLLCVFLGSAIGAQSVTVHDHKKVPVSKKTRLKIIRDNGVVVQGKWHMETSDAVSIMLKSGREVIVPKDDIAQIYRCKRQTNFGFFIGALTGFTGTVLYYNLKNDTSLNVYVGAPVVGVVCGFIGAIIGSMHQSCEEIDLNNLSYYGSADIFIDRRTVGLQFRYRF
jgi:hypothetical protein